MPPPRRILPDFETELSLLPTAPTNDTEETSLFDDKIFVDSIPALAQDMHEGKGGGDYTGSGNETDWGSALFRFHVLGGSGGPGGGSRGTIKPGSLNVPGSKRPGTTPKIVKFAHPTPTSPPTPPQDKTKTKVGTLSFELGLLKKAEKEWFDKITGKTGEKEKDDDRDKILDNIHKNIGDLLDKIIAGLLFIVSEGEYTTGIIDNLLAGIAALDQAYNDLQEYIKKWGKDAWAEYEEETIRKIRGGLVNALARVKAM